MIEQTLKKTYGKIDSIIEVQWYKRGIREYSVRLTNNYYIVVKISEGTCSCKW